MSPDEFDRFRHGAVHALTDLNEDCKRKYSVTDWPRWDYDLDTGTLTFSDGGTPKVIADIQVVGTTSNASRTWMWAWANTSLPLGVTQRARDVRQFGLAEGLTQLTEPQLVDDEYLGWEMTAVMARITDAKGAYRYDNGFMYVVYTDINAAYPRVAAPPTPAPDKGKVDCDVHGSGQQSFACEHLVLDPKQLWFSEEPSAADLWPDAWCVRCDELYQERGAWDDENSSRLRIKLLCHRCYQSLRQQEVRT